VRRRIKLLIFLSNPFIGGHCFDLTQFFI
jgi:hypothetical protein